MSNTIKDTLVELLRDAKAELKSVERERDAERALADRLVKVVEHSAKIIGPPDCVHDSRWETGNELDDLWNKTQSALTAWKEARVTYTPETDNNEYAHTFLEQYGHESSLQGAPVDWVDFARRMEIERDMLKGELNEWKSLRTWGGTPEIIDQFIKGQQTRIYTAQEVETDLQAERERDEFKNRALAAMDDYVTEVLKNERLERALKEAWYIMDTIEGNDAVDEWQNKYSKYMPNYSCPECDALASHGANDGPCEQHKL